MHITILSGSTRINRNSHRVALGLQKAIESLGHTVEVLDLAQYRFPLLEEVLHRHPNAPDGLEEFAEKIRRSDAHLFVTPEYNGSYTAALKNAVDYLKEGEFTQKVIGTVTVTTGALGGMRAALATQQLILALSAFPIPQMLPVGLVIQRFDEAGNLIEPAFDRQLQAFLRAFFWLAEAVVQKQRLVSSLN